MIWNLFEYAATFIEYFIYADFMVRFLEPNKKNNVKWCYLLIFILDSTITLTFNHFMNYEGVLCVLRIGINFTIALFMLNGTLFEKIFTSLILDILALLISFMSLKTLGWVSEKTIEEMIEYRGLIRILNLFITKALLFAATRLLLKLKSSKRYSLSLSEWGAIGIIFVITMAVGLEIFQVDLNAGISSESPISVGIGFGLISINVLMYILMRRMSEKNIENKELVIDKMQNEIYKTQFEESEKKYIEIKKIQHDMENHLQCISMLISEKQYNQANNYIFDIINHRLDFCFTKVNTGNRVVDVISNMKLMQCKNENINTIVNTGHIETAVDDVDMCSLLGNIFDNAIEACRKVKEASEIFVDIHQRKGYINIIIKNTIQSPVLKDNPELRTTKRQKDIHGYGIKAVKDIVERHNGMMELFEQNQLFIVDIWIPSNDFE